MLLTATMSGEWSVGVAVHAGTTRLAYVGLGDVRLESPDERFTPDYVSLQDLCSQNYSRPMSIWIGEDGMLDGGGLLETPHDIWCAFHAAGSSAGSLLGMAWLPAVLALGATSVYELKTWVVRFEEIVARAESLGLTGSLFNYAVLLLWSLLWLLLVMALTAYASLSPGSIGIGEAHFGSSFGLVRAMVLLTSVCGMALGAHTLKLWDARQMGELLQGLKEARALKRSLYVLLLAQLLLYAVVSLQVCLGSSLGLAAPCAAGRRLLGTRHCTRTTRTLPMHHTHRTHTARTPHAHRTHISRTSHAVVSLQVVDFSALICFVGLAYLDTKAPNLLVAYTLLTVATLPLDAVTLCMLGHPASFLQWARSTAYFFILIFKCCSLVLMGMLHTKARRTPIAPTSPKQQLACSTHTTHVPPRAHAPHRRCTRPHNAPATARTTARDT